MNRILILLLWGILSGAWSAGAAADGQSQPSVMTKLMVLFSLRMPHVTVPQNVVAPEKDWAIVKDARSEHARRDAAEKRLREAAQRIADRDRELRLAREAFRQETSSIAQRRQPASSREAQADPLQAAARQISEREQEAYRAKLEYARIAREVREQRRREAALADTHT